MPAVADPGPATSSSSDRAAEHAARVRTAYDTVAEAYAALLPGTQAEAPTDLAAVAAFAAHVGPGRPVADVGCGTGRMTAHLAGLGLDAHGLDLSPGMVAVARRRHPDRRFAVGSLLALPWADATQAGVLAWYSLIHVPPDDLPAACAQVRRVLVPGGHLLVAGQAGSGRRHLAHAYGHDVDLDAWLHDPDGLADVLARAGLEVLATTLRAPTDRERHPQVVVLARRPG